MSDYGHLFRAHEALKAEYEGLKAEFKALKAAVDSRRESEQKALDAIRAKPKDKADA